MQVSQTERQRSGLTTMSRSLLNPLLIAVVPLGFIAALLALKVVDRSWYMDLIREDGPFEDLTLIFYLAAFGLACAAAIVLRRAGESLFSLGYLAIALGCFYIGGEEISWGQRILQIESPAFFERYNQQQELNSHNFLSRYALHALYIVVSALAAFGWIFMPRLISRLPARPQAYLSPRQWMLAPDRRLMLYFLPCLLLYIYYDYLNPIQVWLYGPEWHINHGDTARFFIVAKDQEPIEMLFAVGVMLSVAFVLRRALRLRPAAADAATHQGQASA